MGLLREYFISLDHSSVISKTGMSTEVSLGGQSWGERIHGGSLHSFHALLGSGTSMDFLWLVVPQKYFPSH